MISAKLLPVIEKDSVQPDCVIVTPAPAIAAEIASTPWIAFVAPKVLSSDEVDARLVVSESRHNAHVVATGAAPMAVARTRCVRTALQHKLGPMCTPATTRCGCASVAEAGWCCATCRQVWFVVGNPARPLARYQPFASSIFFAEIFTGTTGCQKS
jgi:hypothetical protein